MPTVVTTVAAPYAYTNDFGYSLWVKKADVINGVIFQATNGGTGTSIYFDGGNITLGAGNGGSTILSTFGAIANNAWTQLSVINFNGTHNLYMNGAQVGSWTGASTLDSPMLGFGQGGINGTTGSVDQLNIYKFNSATDSIGAVQTAMGVVPEASTALLGAVGALAMLRRRRA